MLKENWFRLADEHIRKLEDFLKKASDKNDETNELMNRIASNVSEQWIETYKIGTQQVEDALKTQGKLITTQCDVNRAV